MYVFSFAAFSTKGLVCTVQQHGIDVYFITHCRMMILITDMAYITLVGELWVYFEVIMLNASHWLFGSFL